MRQINRSLRRWLAQLVSACGCAAFVVLGRATAAVELKTCDPFRDQIHQAQALIAKRDTGGASQVLLTIVAADPRNVMGNFLLGTIKLGQPSAAAQEDGLRQLQFAVSQIPGRPELCARQLGWYSLYITLGAQYYRRQDTENAKKTLQIALAHRDALQPSSLQILFDDLGRIALAQGDLRSALDYYSQGAALGNKNSISAVAMVRQLQAEVSKHK